MKKYLLILITLLSLQATAQTFNSIAITAGVPAANQKFLYKDPVALSNKSYVFGYNASIFGEFFTRDYVRWVTEIQYNQKGSLDKQPDANYANQLQYVSWNNYIKVRYELYSIIPQDRGAPVNSGWQIRILATTCQEVVVFATAFATNAEELATELVVLILKPY